MSRRRKHTIDISYLYCCKALRDEIKQRYNIDLDITTFKVEAYETYTPTIRIGLKAVINRLERYIYINGDADVSKKKLVNILKISRPTIDRLIRLGIIQIDRYLTPTLNIEFRLSSTLNQLKGYEESKK